MLLTAEGARRPWRRLQTLRPSGLPAPSRPPSQRHRWFTAGLGGGGLAAGSLQDSGTAGLAGSSSSVRGARGNDPRFAYSHVASARRVWRFGAGGPPGSGGHPTSAVALPPLSSPPSLFLLLGPRGSVLVALSKALPVPFSSLKSSCGLGP